MSADHPSSVAPILRQNRDLLADFGELMTAVQAFEFALLAVVETQAYQPSKIRGENA